MNRGPAVPDESSIAEKAAVARRLSLLAALVLPFVCMGGYLLVTRGLLHLVGNVGDLACQTVITVAAATLIWISALPRPVKIGVILVYCPFLYFALYFFSLLLIGFVFGDWL